MKILFVSLIIIIIDQISKLFIKGFSIPFLDIAYKGMYIGEKIPVIGNFFRITFIENPGMAFGFNPGINLKLWLSLFSLVASIGLILYLYKIRNQRFALRFSIAMILGGAIGNSIDRIFYGVFYHYAPMFYGKVVDFLDFDFFHFSLFGKEFYRWPIFNVADASVSIGVILLLIFYRQPQNSPKPDEKEKSSDENMSNDMDIEQNKPTELDKDVLTSKDKRKRENKLQHGDSDHGEEIPD